jgi:hypothetical protein
MLEAHTCTASLDIDPLSVGWRRCVDINDRALRDIVLAWRPRGGYPRQSGFDITAHGDGDRRRRPRPAMTCASGWARSRFGLGACSPSSALQARWRSLWDALQAEPRQTPEGKPAPVTAGRSRTSPTQQLARRRPRGAKLADYGSPNLVRRGRGME